MNTIYGLYADPDGAQRATDALRGAKVDARDVTIVSSEPFHEYEFGGRDHHSVMPWLAALGGLIGGALGFSLAAYTQRAYALPTGGMPIVSLWPDGIITYETTMLGAILATLITLLVSTRLPRWRDLKDRPYDPAVAEGKILIGVVNPPAGSRAEIAKILRESGAQQVKESF